MKKPPLQDVIVKNREAPRRMERVQRTQFADETVRNRFEHEVGTGHFDSQRERLETEYEQKPVFTRRKREMLRTTNKRWLVIALAIGSIVIMSSVALSLLFAGATVTIYPKQDTVVVNATFTAEENGQNGAVPIEKVTIDRTKERSVVALGEQEVEERATGVLTIYNNYSETPQRIIRRTRFESSDGHIFRIEEGVEIPGKATDGTPGTVEVTVRAEEPGEEYNVPAGKFSIPGYEGYPQAELIYAESKDAMSGGFKGIRRSVGEEERAKVLAELENELRDELQAAAFSSSDNPEGYRLFKEGVFLEFVALPDGTAEADKVTIRLQGKLHGVLFPEDILAKRLAQLTISSYADSPLRIENIEELTVSVAPLDTESGVSPWDAAQYNVSAQGKAHFIWEFDEKQLAKDFAGKDKDVLNTPFEGGVLDMYPGIDRLEVSIRPFWKGRFPEDSEGIQIITKLD
jgi:hypothetical protein